MLGKNCIEFRHFFIEYVVFRVETTVLCFDLKFLNYAFHKLCF